MNISINTRKVYIATSCVEHYLKPPVLVFLHGAGMDHSFWSDQLMGFNAAGYSVIAPDLPGHGQSDGPAPAKIQDYTAWLNELLDKLGINQVSLAGHSMGSLIALDTVISQELQVEKLVLLGTAMPMRVGEALLEAASDDLSAAATMIARFGFAESSSSRGEPLAGRAVQEACVRQLQQTSESVLFNALSACNTYSVSKPAIQRVNCPVHLIIGDSDRMTPPKAAKALAAMLPHVSEVTLKDCGHMHTLEQPQASQEVLERFFIG